MGLNTFTPPSDTLTFPGGSVTLRGLGLDDLVKLVRKHGAQMRPLFAELTSKQTLDLADPSIDAVGMKLLDTAPDLMADVIAFSAGEPDSAAQAKMLPVGVQIEALEKVFRLTLEAEGGVEKLVETVQRVVRTVSSLQRG